MNFFFEKTLQWFGFSGNLQQSSSEKYQNIYRLYNLSRNAPALSYLCFAPWTSISFSIDGYATICCLNKKTSVLVAGKSINDIWNSDSFNQLRKHVASKNMDYDCSICNEQIKTGNFSGTKAIGYDTYLPYDLTRPRVMEFCLENTCNLACTMCNSVLSSTIRKNQELPPLEKMYDEKFVDELMEYIPYLQEAIFSGGEPFLVPNYFRIWEKMIGLNPKIKISVVTNGTTLNERIKDLLEQGRFNINVSIDSVDKATYELVRAGAKFETVMKNFQWFRDYGSRKNLPVNIPVCPLTLNWKTIPDVVRFANMNEVSLNFVYVERPASLSLVHRDPEYLNEVIEFYNGQYFDDSTHFSKNNISRFKELIGFVEKWKRNNLSKKEATEPETLMHSWEEKIMMNQDIPQTRKHSTSREDMVKRIKEAIAEVPEDKQVAVINLLNKFADDRLYSFIEGKSAREIAVVFAEFAGK